jgi:N-sulfoglucosamine sulfohydrolase
MKMLQPKSFSCLLMLATAFLAAAFFCGAATAEDRPNILWLTCEDNNVNWVGCYGNPHADTPNIDKLATEGFQYMHCYANAPVCAPSRSTWITGIHAISMGTHPMRSRYEIPHGKIKYYPDYLKASGYYCSNVKKTDYNIGGRSDGDCWDSNKVDWKVLKAQQPFFQVINSTASHESRAFGSVDNTTHDPANVRLAKYHPDIPKVRQNYAHYHDAMKKMDTSIGEALKALEESGMAENTIVIHNSDHGGVIARSKRFLFNSGTHCPLIVRIPEKYKHLWPAEKPGEKIDRLVSFIDMPKTWLKLADAEIPKEMQGQVFLGPDAEKERPYHVSFRERMDERNDNVRAIRNKRFLYVRNYMPYAPWGQHLNYLWIMEATKAWEAHHKAGKTDAITGRFFGTKPMEELYDTAKDPDNVHNLIDKPEHQEIANELRGELRKWQLKMHDSGLLPEADRVKRAADNNLTIYEMVRNEKLYNLPAYLDAADLALENDAANLPKLVKLLDDKDAGVRYWATVGCFLIADKSKSAQPRIRKLLTDDSHEVRALAAWILIKQGDETAGKKVLSGLLRESSYASLKVLNIIDWLGEGPDQYSEAILACNNGDSYVNRMKQYFGVAAPPKPKRNRKKK